MLKFKKSLEPSISNLSTDYQINKSSIVDQQHISGEIEKELWLIDEKVKFCEKCSSIIQSKLFNGFIMTIIIINSISMGLETLYIGQKQPILFKILNEIFTFIYTIEFILKIYVKKLNYFKSLWNWFDFINLIIAYIDITIDLLDSENRNSFLLLEALRSFKAFRTLRAVSFVKGLQVILRALIKTLLNSVINVIIVILLIMFIFSIIANSLFTNDDWSSLGVSMWTLFRFICGDEWPEIQKNIDNFPGSRIFTIFFVFIGNFIFANIFIGLIIMNISEAQETHKKALNEQKMKAIGEKKEKILKRQADELAQILKENKSSDYFPKNFSELIKTYYEKLSHTDDMIKSKKLCTNLTWLKLFLKTCKILDQQSNLVKSYHLEMANCLSSLIEERLMEEKKNA